MPIFGDPIYWFCTGGRTSLGSTYGTNNHAVNEPSPDPHEPDGTPTPPPPPPSSTPPLTPPFAQRRLDLGMALFSVGISFIHPVQGDRVTVQIVPEPRSFQKIRDALTQSID